MRLDTAVYLYIMAVLVGSGLIGWAVSLITP